MSYIHSKVQSNPENYPHVLNKLKGHFDEAFAQYERGVRFGAIVANNTVNDWYKDVGNDVIAAFTTVPTEIENILNGTTGAFSDEAPGSLPITGGRITGNLEIETTDDPFLKFIENGIEQGYIWGTGDGIRFTSFVGDLDFDAKDSMDLYIDGSKKVALETDLFKTYGLDMVMYGYGADSPGCYFYIDGVSQGYMKANGGDGIKFKSYTGDIDFEATGGQVEFYVDGTKELQIEAGYVDAKTELREAGARVFSPNHLPTWSEISGKPSTFAPSSHSHYGVYMELNNPVAQADIDMDGYNLLNAGNVSLVGHTHSYLSSGFTVAGNHTFYSTDTAGSYSNSGVEIREVNAVAAAQSSNAYAPQLSFHWGGRKQASIALHADGSLYARTSATDTPNFTGIGMSYLGLRESGSTKWADIYLRSDDEDFEVANGNGTWRFGMRNGSYTHFDTTGTSGFYFYKRVTINGDLTFTADTSIHSSYGEMINMDDGWLRINQGSAHSSGIFTGSSLIRTDAELQVGGSGSTFRASASHFTYKGNTICHEGNVKITKTAIRTSIIDDTNTHNLGSVGVYTQYDYILVYVSDDNGGSAGSFTPVLIPTDTIVINQYFLGNIAGSYISWRWTNTQTIDVGGRNNGGVVIDSIYGIKVGV